MLTVQDVLSVGLGIGLAALGGCWGRGDEGGGQEGGQKLVGRGSLGAGGDKVLDLVEERREGAQREIWNNASGPPASQVEAVRPRTPRRDLDHFDTGVRQDRVERRRELPGAVADEEPESGGAVVEVHDEVAGLLGGLGSIDRWSYVRRSRTHRFLSRSVAGSDGGRSSVA
jgi:hypothetical protein